MLTEADFLSYRQARLELPLTAKTAETVRVDIRRDVRLINASAVVSLWSALEVGIEDFLIA